MHSPACENAPTGALVVDDDECRSSSAYRLTVFGDAADWTTRSCLGLRSLTTRFCRPDVNRVGHPDLASHSCRLAALRRSAAFGRCWTRAALEFADWRGDCSPPMLDSVQTGRPLLGRIARALTAVVQVALRRRTMLDALAGRWAPAPRNGASHVAHSSLARRFLSRRRRTEGFWLVSSPGRRLWLFEGTQQARGNVRRPLRWSSRLFGVTASGSLLFGVKGIT